MRVFALGCLLVAAQAFAVERPPWGTGKSSGEDLVISLVTFGPGDDIPSWFGHTALVVEDRKANQARLYNYGMFDFEKFAKFALGRLEFWVGEQSYGWTLRAYKELGRDVRISELNLTPAARLQIAQALADNVLPENRDYLYHHYLDNCATRPRDMIDRAIGGQLHKFTSGPARYTLRGHTRRYSSVLPPMSVLLDFLMNDEIDKPIARWDEAFLPNELENQINELSYVNTDGQTVPLVKSHTTYFQSDRKPIPEEPPNYTPTLLFFSLLFGAVPLWLVPRMRTQRWARKLLAAHQAIIGFVFGLPGFVLLLMWLITNHTVTFHNEDLFLANPITLLLLPFGLMLLGGSPRALKWLPRLNFALAALGLLGLLLKTLPWFDQNNWRIIAMILPISVGSALSFALDARKVKALAPAAATT